MRVRDVRNMRVREGRWKSHEGRKQQPSLLYSTFFFSNFPGSRGEIDMFKMFQRWARVKEVCIVRKLNRWGRRFGFVSFLDVENVANLERELVWIYIGNMKIHVNIPRYKKVGVEQEAGLTRVSAK